MDVNLSQEAMTPPSSGQRIAALELLVQQLVFVLEAEGALPEGAMDAWLCVCIRRMRETGSAPAGDVAALQALRERVAQ